MHIELIPVLKDNYIFLLRDEAAGVTAVVDPAQADEVLEALAKRGWRLDYILNTHHHGDHIGGNRALKKATGCQVVGYAGDAARIPEIDIQLNDGDRFMFGTEQAEVMFVPGHTLGHIAYYFPKSAALFCGDTLFAMGCGRLFEGTPEMMVKSLARIQALPDKAHVYCAHEYTQSNGRFAETVEPNNPYLIKRMEEVAVLREAGKPTIPTTILDEKLSNPFLRTASDEIRATLGMPNASEVEVFAELRERKNRF